MRSPRSPEQNRIVFGRMLLVGCRGEVAGLALIERSEAAARARNEGVVLTFGEHARALLYNARGQHEDALGPAQSASSREELMLSVWSLPELIEAAARSGRRQMAQEAVGRLATCTQAAGTGLALGVEARVRALVSDGETAEALHREAVHRLAKCRLSLELARAHLGYGEWLRREQRRVDARDSLRKAHEMFSLMGAEALAERARRELQATGETVRARVPESRDELTAQEAQIAELARDGLSNPEIGARHVHQPAHRPVPPEQGLREARDQLPQPASRRPAERDCRVAIRRAGQCGWPSRRTRARTSH